MRSAEKSVLGLVASGFFITLPLLLAVLLLGKMYGALQGVVHALLDALPGNAFRVPAVRFLAVSLVIVGLLALVGWLAQTRLGKRIGRWLEARLLNRLPMYTFFRNLAGGLAGRDGAESLKPVLVEMNPGVQQMGLLVERHADGSGTVFLPSSPNPGSGTVAVVAAALMRELRAPAHKIFKCQSGWGYGTVALLEMSPDTRLRSPDQPGQEEPKV